MDAAERNRADLLKALLELGARGRFLSTVDLLERLVPHAPLVGGDGPPRLEALRFRSNVSLGFATGDIKRVGVVKIPSRSLEPDRHVIEVEATFLGLTGSSSPLPNYLVEQILHENPDDPIRRDFLDVFHHRLLSLVYRGIARSSVPRAHTSRTTSAWVTRALTLGGIDAYEGPPTKYLPTSAVLRMLPLLVGRARGARSLRKALRYVLAPTLDDDVSVDVVENLEGWLEIDLVDRMVLGKNNHALGLATHIGSRAPERSGRFGIRIGPLRMTNYRRFLPGGDQLPLIRETVQLFTRNTVDYELQLVVASSAVPAFALSAEHPGSLGRTTWLAGQQSERIVTVADPQRTDTDPPARTAPAAAMADSPPL